MIDLRSDTVTKPSKEMRAIMAAAEVGDDVYREDPSVQALEEYSADLSGKKAALFVSSGTMGNLIPIMLQAPRGTEVLMHQEAHTFRHEQSGIAALAGCKPMPVSGERGILNPTDLEAKVSSGNPYYNEISSLIVIENTHNFCGGTLWSKADFEKLAVVAKKHKLPIHMDGARAFNAQVAGELTLKEMAKYCNSLTFCLSKGLGAPIGAMICGDKELIDQALRLRKMLGGGMRQVGVAAAAGLYALKHNVNRLAEDHNKTKLLVNALNKCDWGKAEGNAETNIVFAQTFKPAQHIVDQLAKHGILCLAMDSHRLRMVTHLDITDDDIKTTIQAIGSIG